MDSLRSAVAKQKGLLRKSLNGNRNQFKVYEDELNACLDKMVFAVDSTVRKRKDFESEAAIRFGVIGILERLLPKEE